MLEKLWEVKKEMLSKPYNKLSKAELVINSLWMDFVSKTFFENGRIIFIMITGEKFSA